jgi:outer membrane receptor protein involved in Fe transport
VLGVDEPDGPIVQSGSPTTPQGFFRLRRGNVFGLPPGPYTLIAGHSGTAASDFRSFDFAPEDLFNFAPYNYLQTPSRRAAGWLFGYTDWGSVRPFFEAYYSKRESEQVLAPSTFLSREPGAAPLIVGGSGGQGIPANNFYNPFGNDVLGVQRRMLELGERISSQHVAAWRAVAGLRGELHAWSWELAYGHSDQTTSQRKTGNLLRSRLALAVGPSGRNSAGDIVCGAPDPTTDIVPTAAVIAGCVPLNLFGGQGVNGLGTISPEQLAYVSAPLTDHGENREDLVNALISGDWVRLPAGPLRAALGFEWREEFTRFALDPLAASTGVSGSDLNDLPQGAAFAAREIFAEVEVPLIANRRFAENVTVDFGARHSDFSSFGSDDSLRAGVRWRLVSQIMLRSQYARVFRAPDLASLHNANIPILVEVSDPCGQGDQSSGQRTRCAAQGVPDGYEQGAVPFVPALAGGNSQLVPESGETLGFGIVLQPSQLPGLRASLDYWRIKLTNAIGSIGGQAILDGCVNDNVQPLCERIKRAADGSIDEIDARTANLGRLAGAGYDIAVNWQAAARGNQFFAAIIISRLSQFETTATPGAQTQSVAGKWDDDFNPVALPRWRGLGHLDWRRNSWRAGYAVEYIGSYRECRLFDEPVSVCYHQVNARLYHDIEAGYEPDRGLSMTLSISNLMDENPPLVFGEANTDPSTYRLLGRTYAARLGYRFR